MRAGQSPPGLRPATFQSDGHRGTWAQGRSRVLLPEELPATPHLVADSGNHSGIWVETLKQLKRKNAEVVLINLRLQGGSGVFICSSKNVGIQKQLPIPCTMPSLLSG